MNQNSLNPITIQQMLGSHGYVLKILNEVIKPAEDFSIEVNRRLIVGIPNNSPLPNLHHTLSLITLCIIGLNDLINTCEALEKAFPDKKLNKLLKEYDKNNCESNAIRDILVHWEAYASGKGHYQTGKKTLKGPKTSLPKSSFHISIKLNPLIFGVAFKKEGGITELTADLKSMYDSSKELYEYAKEHVVKVRADWRGGPYVLHKSYSK